MSHPDENHMCIGDDGHAEPATCLKHDCSYHPEDGCELCIDEHREAEWKAFRADFNRTEGENNVSASETD